MQIANVKTNTRQIYDNNPFFERRIQNATDGLSKDCFNWLLRVADNNKDNVTVITNYIVSMKTEANLSDGYRKNILILLSKFSINFIVAPAIADRFRVRGWAWRLRAK